MLVSVRIDIRSKSNIYEYMNSRVGNLLLYRLKDPVWIQTWNQYGMFVFREMYNVAKNA